MTRTTEQLEKSQERKLQQRAVYLKKAIEYVSLYQGTFKAEDEEWKTAGKIDDLLSELEDWD